MLLTGQWLFKALLSLELQSSLDLQAVQEYLLHCWNQEHLLFSSIFFNCNHSVDSCMMKAYWTDSEVDAVVVAHCCCWCCWCCAVVAVVLLFLLCNVLKHFIGSRCSFCNAFSENANLWLHLTDMIFVELWLVRRVAFSMILLRRLRTSNACCLLWRFLDWK